MLLYVYLVNSSGTTYVYRYVHVLWIKIELYVYQAQTISYPRHFSKISGRFIH